MALEDEWEFARLTRFKTSTTQLEAKGRQCGTCSHISKGSRKQGKGVTNGLSRFTPVTLVICFITLLTIIHKLLICVCVTSSFSGSYKSVWLTVLNECLLSKSINEGKEGVGPPHPQPGTPALSGQVWGSAVQQAIKQASRNCKFSSSHVSKTKRRQKKLIN